MADPAERYSDLINKLSEYQTQLKAAGEDQAKVASITEKMLASLTEGLEALRKKGEEATKKLEQGFEKIDKKVKETIKDTKEATQSFNKAGTVGEEATRRWAAGGENANRVLEQTKNRVDEIAERLSNAANKAMAFVGAFSRGDVGGALSTFFPKIGRITSALQDTYDYSRRLNKSLLEFAGATQPIGAAAAKVGSYSGQIQGVASAMGLSIEQAHEYAKSMLETGLSLDQVTGKVKVGNQQMMLMKAAQASGISAGLAFGEANKLLSEQMLYLGKSSEEAVKGIVNIGVAARNAGVSAKILMPVIQNLMGQFRYLGMDVEKTENFVGKFGKGSAANIELMGKAMGGMLQMSTGAKALFGMIGGLPGARGAGAIGAGFAFERALAGGSGGPEAAFGAIGKALTQFTGGGIVGQEKVLSGQASRQEETRFYMQRELMMKQLGLSQQEAGRTLELISRVEKGTAGKKDREELQKTMENVGKDQAYYVRKTFESSVAIKNAVDQVRLKLAPILENIFGSVSKILFYMGAASAVGIAGTVFGGSLTRRAIKGVFGGAGRGAIATEVAEGSIAQFVEDKLVTSGLKEAVPKSTGWLKKLGVSATKRGLGAAGKRIPFVGGLISAGIEGGVAISEGASAGQVAVRAAGAGVGSAAGSVIGGAIGSFITPGVGTAVGAALGSVIGEWAGSKVGRYLAERDAREIDAIKQKIKLGKELSDEEKKRYAAAIAQETQLGRKLVEKTAKTGASEKFTEGEREYLRDIKGKQEFGIELTAQEKKDLRGLERKEAAYNVEAVAKKLEETQKQIAATTDPKKMSALKETELKQIKEVIDAKEKEKSLYKIGSETYANATDSLKQWSKMLEEVTLQQKLSTTKASAADIKTLQETLRGSGLKLSTEETTRMAAGDLSLLQGMGDKQRTLVMNTLKDFAANTASKSAAKDVKDVTKGGVAFLSPGDWVVDKDSIANILGGEKGAAVPNITQELGKVLSAGAGTAMHGFAAGGTTRTTERTAAAAFGTTRAVTGGNEITIHVKGEGILEKLIDERVVVNVQNGTIVGTTKTKAAVTK